MAETRSARDIFLEALDQAPADRPAYLDEACGPDAVLRQRVEALLRVHDDPGAFLSEMKPAASDAGREPVEAPVRANDAAPPALEATVDSVDRLPETEAHVDPTSDIGALLAGRYQLIEEIGEGGMGTVFLAHQTEPVKRAVAVKVIKAGMDSKAVLARFEAERQALAVMDHPNIAKVLDAGSTDGGLPFFVMELVKGTPITRYCDEHRLTPRQRLELFVPVCHAIQHAHQKGIIHRDIKPSNVLVALYDDRPVPKVIDFGVAKAAGEPLTDRSLMTGFGALVGTPEYMSPEQASLNNLDIDTRSDVYSLGVLLYELLTGTTPVDRQRLGRAALLEILRIVREVEAPRPSARLSTIEALPSVAANRGTEPARLAILMKGELDWLVMKALEKDRTRRYETANGLARDILRYLADEVVEARPPSLGYRASKFVRRHKGQVIAASLVLLVLVGGMVGTTLGLFEARRQTAEKEKARQAEADRVKERDDALTLEAQRVKERDAALEDANYHLDSSRFLLALAAYDNRDVSLARLRLGSIEPKHRGWEWDYLRRLCIGGIFTLLGHTGPVKSLAFSPDGTRIVTGSDDNTAKVWDARTGMSRLELKGHTAQVVSVAFSPDGTGIVTGSEDGTAKVWDARAGTSRLELKGHTGAVTSVAFSPDGTRLVTSDDDGTGKVWDARTGRPQLEVKHKDPVTCVAFSPDSTRIGTGGGQRAKVWDARTGTPLLEWNTGVLKGGLASTPVELTCLAFSPDGTRIVTAGSFDNTAKVWDARTGKALLELQGHTAQVTSVAFSPDGTRIVSGSEDDTAKVWDARTGTPLLDLKGHTAQVASVAFSPDGTRIATSSFDETAKMWDARTGTPQRQLKGYGSAFSPDGTRIVTGSEDDTAKVWDARTCTPLLELKTGVLAGGLAFSPDGTRIVTGCADGTAKVWDAGTGKLRLELKQKGLVNCVAFSPDSTRIVTGSYSSSPKVWDARAGTLQLELNGHRGAVTGLAFSPDGTRIVSGSMDLAPRTVDQVAMVWDSLAGTLQLELKGHTGWLSSVAFSPDGTRIVTGSVDKTAKVWDARTGAPLLELKGHTRPVKSVAFSPDGTRIVTGSEDGTGKVWDARTGAPLLELSGHPGEVSHVAFSADGTRIVTSSPDGTVKLWDTRTPQLGLKGQTGTVSSVEFSPDGTRLVTGCADGTAKVWDTRTGKLQLELKGHTSKVTGVAFSVDGTHIVTTGRPEKTAKVWDARTGQELQGEPIPQTIKTLRVTHGESGSVPAATSISPDGRIFVHALGGLVELVPVLPDEEEISYRRSHTQPNLGRYREGYEAARAANDEFAARFYLNLLPPAEQEVIKAQTAADRELAAGRAEGALVHLVRLSVAKPGDSSLAVLVACLQAWFGQDRELADTCARALESAKGTTDPTKWDQLACICCLVPTPDPTRREAALALARKAVEVKGDSVKLTLGMAEYRSGHFTEADAALTAAAKYPNNGPNLVGTASFYRAMSLFRKGKEDEARKLAIAAAARMKPLPKDEKNPLAGGAMPYHLILWLAYKEAKGLIQFDAGGATPTRK